MKNFSIDLTGKLPAGMRQLYTTIHQHSAAMGIGVLVVGAMARDLVLSHGYGADIERGTRDVDFAISVGSWQDFEALRERLLADEHFAETKHLQKLEFTDDQGAPWEADIVPFGDIANNHAISWPPKNDFQMSVLGFEEAFESSIAVTIEKDIAINVASPAGICLLKLIAWTDREIEKRKKDALDIRYLIASYSKIPEINDALYDSGYMEEQDWDDTFASAVKLGVDTGAIASEDSFAVLRQWYFTNEKNQASFARDMIPEKHVIDIEHTINLLSRLLAGLEKGFLDK